MGSYEKQPPAASGTTFSLPLLTGRIVWRRLSFIAPHRHRRAMKRDRRGYRNGRLSGPNSQCKLQDRQTNIMADNEIRFLGDLERLDLRKGDRFVLSVDQPLPQKAHNHIQEAWKQFVGGKDDALQLLILDRGMKIGVMAVPPPEREMNSGLEEIRDQVQRWMDYDRAQRDKEGLGTTDDTHIMCPPVWPSHGQLKNWVACLSEAAKS